MTASRVLVPRVLVVGPTGQVGSAACAAAAAFGLAAVPAGRPDFDFDRPESIDAVFAAAAPELVINTAAWTAVDAAEDAPEAAMRANAEGPARLAALCAAAGVPLIHVSTDYVFDGSKGAPYRETDPVAPLGVYGATKLAGERAVLASGARAVVLRTAWVYSPGGKNFVRTILFAATGRKEPLRVVADQRGNPTAAADLADAILAIAARILRDGWRDEYAGVFHAVGSGETTWHGLAIATVHEAAAHGVSAPEPLPITTAEWPTRAPRPADSRLDCTRLREAFGLRLPEWPASLSRTVAAIFAAGEMRDRLAATAR